MELADYLAALRRHWITWVSITLLALLFAGLSLALAPTVYTAKASIFVSASPSVPNSAQYAAQRVKSYPDVASSQSVLNPVIARLSLDESLAEIRARVTATNPTDTSQVDVYVTGGDPAEAAAIANAVAVELTDYVQQLETPPTGDREITLTVTNPASVPTTPTSPVPLYNIGLGLVAGLFIGMAVAIIRTRTDTAVYTEADARDAWGDWELDILASRTGDARRNPLTGRLMAVLARRIELNAQDGPVRVAVFTPVPGARPGAPALCEDLAAALRDAGVPTTVITRDGGLPAGQQVAVYPLEVPVALRNWQDVGARLDEVVIAVAPGTCDRRELHEIRTILEMAGVTPHALVITDKPGSRIRRRARPVAPHAPLIAQPAPRPEVGAGPVGGTGATELSGAAPMTEEQPRSHDRDDDLRAADLDDDTLDADDLETGDTDTDDLDTDVDDLDHGDKEPAGDAVPAGHTRPAVPVAAQPTGHEPAGPDPADNELAEDGPVLVEGRRTDRRTADLPTFVDTRATERRSTWPSSRPKTNGSRRRSR